MYKRNNQGWLAHMDFILLDALTLQLAFVIAFIIRQGLRNPYQFETYRTLAIMFFVVDILIAAIFDTMHLVMSRGYFKEFKQTLKQVAYVLVIISLFLFSFKSGGTYSRTVVFLTAGFHLVLGYSFRQLWKPVVRRICKERAKPTMLLVVDEERIPEVMPRVRATGEFELKGIVLTNRDGEGEIIEGKKVVANLSDAAQYICREWVDKVFIDPSEFADVNAEINQDDGEPSIALLVEQCREMAVPVHVRLPISNTGDKSFVERVGGYSVLTTASNYVSPMEYAMKRVLDIAGGLVGSIIALIIIAAVAPIIKKESPGPILFKQTRIGQNGKKFQIYKIRSMYMDAEERKKDLMKDNRVSDGMMFKLDWDPRIIGNKIVDGKQVTGIGEFIRSHSLDEFPQFFNVLLNQMSLVGTRPPTVDEWEKYKYHHRARLATKPGITGMWQVSGRSDITDFEEVVRLDTEYINHWTIGMDFRILLRTVNAVLAKEGAM